MQFFKDLFHLFFPVLCSCCHEHLSRRENVICTNCRHELSLANFSNFSNNPLEKSFHGKIPIYEASAMFLYHREGKVQQLIHQLKYKGRQEIGSFIGKWMGYELAESTRFKTIDYIVPVPLHPKKLKERGYNQLTTFGEALSKYLGAPFITTKLTKTASTTTQTYQGRIARSKNVQEVFILDDLNFFNNKHVLLIDDVITTGATIEACSQQLLKTSTIKISIAVMAYTI